MHAKGRISETDLTQYFFIPRVNKGGDLELPMANGNVMKIPVDDLEKKAVAAAGEEQKKEA